MQYIPEELQRKIMTLLDPIHLIMAGCVCRQINQLHLSHLLIPMRLECYFEVDEYGKMSADEISNERSLLHKCDITNYHRQAERMKIPSRLIFIWEMIFQIDQIIGDRRTGMYGGALQHYSLRPAFPSFYKKLLRNPRNSDFPHRIINKVRRMGGTVPDVNYSIDKQFQLSFLALVY